MEGEGLFCRTASAKALRQEGAWANRQWRPSCAWNLPALRTWSGRTTRAGAGLRVVWFQLSPVRSQLPVFSEESGPEGWGRGRQREEPAARESGQRSEHVHILPGAGNRNGKQGGYQVARERPQRNQTCQPLILDSQPTPRKSFSAVQVPLSVTASVNPEAPPNHLMLYTALGS